MHENDILARIDRLESHQAIQQLAVRYARAVDSRNLEEVSRLFSPKTNFGEWGAGASGARAFFHQRLNAFYRSFHQIVGHQIDWIEGDEARGTVACRAEHEDGDNWILNLMVYFDRYVRMDGAWYFLGRRPRYLFIGDINENPRAISFNDWPSRAGEFRTELPQSDDSWNEYWTDWPEERARVTTLP